MKLQHYRYFLGIRPDAARYPFFLQLAAAIGQPIRLDLLHLTLCVIGETPERDRFITGKVRRALRGVELHSFPVNLSRVVAGPSGACARTFGRQDEIQDFYRLITRLLRAWEIEPLHRKSGLHPHVTMAYERCPSQRFDIALSWFPDELLLIESEVGLGKHNVLAQWPLLPPRQGLLSFWDASDGQLIPAEGRARRSAA